MKRVVNFRKMFKNKFNLRKAVAIATCLAVTTVFSGCKDKNEDDNLKEFTVQNRDALNQNMYADETGGKSLTFATTGAWTSSISKKSATKAGGTVDWISINPASGAEAGEYTITISLATNNTGEDRSVVITITCNGENLVITVTQKAETKDGKPIAIEVSNPQALTQILEANQTQGESLTFTTSTAWTSSIEPSSASSWLSINPNSGTTAGTYTVVVNLEPNYTSSDRTANIIITCSETSMKVHITQKAANENEPGSDPNANISMRTAKSGEVRLGIGGSGEMIIDWGDGTSLEQYTLSNSRPYTHTYSIASSRIISIYGENITYLDCSGNQLTNLDVSNNTALTYLNCEDNQLINLDVSKNTALTGLSCNNNPLIGLDVSKNTALGTLYCGNNQLTSLDVSNNIAVEILECSNNQLTSLDVSKNTKMRTLFCRNIQLTSLDVSKNTALGTLYCGNNQLTSLDVSKNTALCKLDCSRNQFETDALETLFGTLRILDIYDGICFVYIRDNPGTAACNKSIAEDKGWTVNTTSSAN